MLIEIDQISKVTIGLFLQPIIIIIVIIIIIIIINHQSLFVLTLSKEKLQCSMKILKVKIIVLAAWNNHRSSRSQAAS